MGTTLLRFSGAASYLNLLRFVFVDLHRGDVKRESKAGNTWGVVYRTGPEGIRAMTCNEDYEDSHLVFRCLCY